MNYDYRAALTVDEVIAELQKISDWGHGDELLLINNDETLNTVCWVDRQGPNEDFPAGALLHLGEKSWS